MHTLVSPAAFDATEHRNEREIRFSGRPTSERECRGTRPASPLGEAARAERRGEEIFAIPHLPLLEDRQAERMRAGEGKLAKRPTVACSLSPVGSSSECLTTSNILRVALPFQNHCIP
jgi:hypothetical protein